MLVIRYYLFMILRTLSLVRNSIVYMCVVISAPVWLKCKLCQTYLAELTKIVMQNNDAMQV